MELINDRERKKENKKEKERTIPIANTKERKKDVERASRRKDKAFRAKALYATPNQFNRLKRGIAIIDSDLGLGDDTNQSINPFINHMLASSFYSCPFAHVPGLPGAKAKHMMMMMMDKPENLG